MSDYKDNLTCQKLVGDGKVCGKSPAREIHILGKCLCEEHQKELTKFINRELGEDYE